MKEEYYTPDDEDIRIGYEYDLLNSKIIIEDRYDLDIAFDQPIRTSYLTKEQIEAEGWKKQYKKGTWRVYQKYPIHIVLMYDEEKHELSIDNDFMILYQGECKSINEFRYICKLLKI